MINKRSQAKSIYCIFLLLVAYIYIYIYIYIHIYIIIYMLTIWMFKYTVSKLAFRLWINNNLRICLMSRPRRSLLGQLWLQFHWLIRRSQTQSKMPLSIPSSVSLTHWLTLLEPEYCPTSLPVRITWEPVCSWLAPVLLSSSMPIPSFYSTW